MWKKDPIVIRASTVKGRQGMWAESFWESGSILNTARGGTHTCKICSIH